MWDFQLLREEYEQLEEDRLVLTHPRTGAFPKGKAEPPVGVNLARLIKLAQANYKLDANRTSTLSPVDIVEKVRALENSRLRRWGALSEEERRREEVQFIAQYGFSPWQ